jgi:hypothetical protein
VHFGIIGAKLSSASEVLDVTNRYSFKVASDYCFDLPSKKSKSKNAAIHFCGPPHYHTYC